MIKILFEIFWKRFSVDYYYDYSLIYYILFHIFVVLKADAYIAK